MAKGIGWCQNTACPGGPLHGDGWNARFLLECDGTYRCDRCFRTGRVELEKSQVHGDGQAYHEVRINFMFDHTKRVYRSVAVVRDESAKPSSIYEIWSPIMRTEKRALSHAELLLGNLNRRPHIVGTPEASKVTEHMLDMDAPAEAFSRALERIAAEWRSR